MTARADAPPGPTPATGLTPRFLLLHLLAIPGALALAAWVAQASGLDAALAGAFFDPGAGAFPARASAVLEVLGHRFAKSAVLLLWCLLLAAALATTLLRPLLDGVRLALWAGVGGMALGPVAVSLLKELNSHHCPWGLRAFGGYAEFSAAWFVPPPEVGHCFPSGHAAAGFCVVALAFTAMALGRPRLARAALAAALAAGVLFSAVRIAQGAHFLSHNLWSAAIDWAAAALAFVPLAARPGA